MLGRGKFPLHSKHICYMTNINIDPNKASWFLGRFFFLQNSMLCKQKPVWIFWCPFKNCFFQSYLNYYAFRHFILRKAFIIFRSAHFEKTDFHRAASSIYNVNLLLYISVNFRWATVCAPSPWTISLYLATLWWALPSCSLGRHRLSLPSLRQGGWCTQQRSWYGSSPQGPHQCETRIVFVQRPSGWDLSQLYWTNYYDICQGGNCDYFEDFYDLGFSMLQFFLNAAGLWTKSVLVPRKNWTSLSKCHFSLFLSGGQRVRPEHGLHLCPLPLGRHGRRVHGQPGDIHHAHG